MSLAQATPHRFAVAALVAALALTGCGRKGPLELPPGTPPDPVTRGLDATHLTNTPAANPSAVPAPAPTQAAQTNYGPASEDPSLVQPPNKSYQVPASTQLNQAVSSPAPPPINRASDQKTGKQFVLDPLL